MLRVPSRLPTEVEELVTQVIGCYRDQLLCVVNFNVPVLQDGLRRIVL